MAFLDEKGLENLLYAIKYGDIKAGALQNALKVAGITYDGTSSVDITLEDMGIYQPMNYLGTTTENLYDGYNFSYINIDGTYKDLRVGDVVINENTKKEFLWAGSQFVELGSLPKVTSSDNGKVLMVVDGTWQAVTLTLSTDESGVMTIGYK